MNRTVDRLLAWWVNRAQPDRDRVVRRLQYAFTVQTLRDHVGLALYRERRALGAVEPSGAMADNQEGTTREYQTR